MPYLPILIIIAYAIFFCRAAEFEDESVLIWGGLSVTISAVAFFGLGCGWLGISLGQLGLFVGITVFRILRKQ
ncbi:MAG TPA: hypothetical protein VK810_05495 [Dongiaceae bacterium]|jgi:hypothetical protein|nr:hypothetical protein [Dongiaceae bacterium]